MPEASASTVLAPRLDRAQLTSWYLRNRARSRSLFDFVAPDAYYTRPIALRHPIVFYEGHLPGSAGRASTRVSSNYLPAA
jgi:iron(II)-dependent oxidoreductase